MHRPIRSNDQRLTRLTTLLWLGQRGAGRSRTSRARSSRSHGTRITTVFCVRLLNPAIDGFADVERYFRGVVEPVAIELGYRPFETGHDPTEYAWMNEEIFDKLHYSGAVVVDVTGLRNNCFMELGYGLGRQNKVIVTAKDGTKAPFDSAMIPHHSWQPTIDDALRRSALKQFWANNVDRPPIVRPRSVL